MLLLHSIYAGVPTSEHKTKSAQTLVEWDLTVILCPISHLSCPQRWQIVSYNGKRAWGGGGSKHFPIEFSGEPKSTLLLLLHLCSRMEYGFRYQLNLVGNRGTLTVVYKLGLLERDPSFWEYFLNLQEMGLLPPPHLLSDFQHRTPPKAINIFTYLSKPK